MTAGVNEPPFPHNSEPGDSSAERGHAKERETRSGETAPAGEEMAADNPVENNPFPGTMGHG